MMRQSLACALLCVIAAMATNSFVDAARYQDTVISLQPTYYYQLNETDTAGGVIDSMGNAALGAYNGDYVNGSPQVGVPGPAFVGSSNNDSGFYPQIDLPGLGEGNLAHASNNAGHINLGPSQNYGNNSMSVAMFIIGGGSAQGGDRLFTNNLTDPTRSFQVNVGNNGIVVAVDPSQTGVLAERTVYLPDSSGHDRNMISPSNGWFHVVAATEGATGAQRAENIRVWINGVDRTPNLMPDVTGWGTDTTIAKIGGRRENATDTTTHSGMQDEVAIWLDRALTDAEVEALWQAAISDIPTLPCDFDGNTTCDVDDINAMTARGDLVAGVPAAGDPMDLTRDGTINTDDITEWLAQAGPENGWADPYKLGDGNLDGKVDGDDFSELGNNWQKGTLNGPPGSPVPDTSLVYSQGDYNGDFRVNGDDFSELGNNWQSMLDPAAAAASAVPEPSSLALVMAVGLGLLFFRRR